jgi:DNA-binding NarL/FixJ family response regulator
MAMRMLIVEDHPLYAEALRLVVSGDFPGAEIVAAGTIDEARAVLAANTKFDLALLDLWLPGTHGLDGLMELRKSAPKLPIMVVSAFTEATVVGRAMICGAAGFIAKSVTRWELVMAIRKVLRGEVVLPISGAECASLPEAGDGASAWRLRMLTQQQLRVLHMLCQGKLNKQIAHDLEVGETTVKAHVSEVLRKLGVSSRTQAVVELCNVNFMAMQPFYSAGGTTSSCRL